MSERDEIEKIILETYQTDFGVPVTGTFKDCADAILTAGYHKPRIVDVEALNDIDTPGVVVRDADGRVAELSKDEGFGNVWKPTMAETWQDTKFGVDGYMFKSPVTILYTPEEAR